MLIIANSVFCGLIVLLSLLRVCGMTKATRRSIVYGNAFMAGGAAAAFLGPFAWGMQVHPAVVFMEATHVYFLLVCQRLWENPLPLAFRRHPVHPAAHRRH